MSLQCKSFAGMGNKPKAALLIACLLALPAASQAASSSEESCRACHKMDSKLIGPAFMDVAARYANAPDAIAHLKQSMLNGSSGRWGDIAMPANAGLTEAEAQSFAYWIMSLNKPPKSSDTGVKTTTK